MAAARRVSVATVAMRKGSPQTNSACYHAARDAPVATTAPEPPEPPGSEPVAHPRLDHGVRELLVQAGVLDGHRRLRGQRAGGLLVARREARAALLVDHLH